MDAILAIDSSGSTNTGSGAPGEAMKVFELEVVFARKLAELYKAPRTTVITWSTKARHFLPDEPITSDGGGTEPVCLYQNPEFKERMNSDHVILVTDGIIDERSISRFFMSMNSMNNSGVFTFLIVSDAPTPARVNVSVAIPVISLARRAVFLFYSPKACERLMPRVMHTINSSCAVPEITDESTWESFPYFDETCIASEDIPAGEHIPPVPGFIRMPNGELLPDITLPENHDKLELYKDHFKFATAIFRNAGRSTEMRRALNSMESTPLSTEWEAHARRYEKFATSAKVFSCSR